MWDLMRRIAERALYGRAISDLVREWLPPYSIKANVDGRVGVAIVVNRPK